MLRTVKDACQLHPMALDYAMGDQIENLSDVIDRNAADAREFFSKNFVTKGMELLLSQGLKRLAGKSDQAVFELKQAMGGGNTNSDSTCTKSDASNAYPVRISIMHAYSELV